TNKSPNMVGILLLVNDSRRDRGQTVSIEAFKHLSAAFARGGGNRRKTGHVGRWNKRMGTSRILTHLEDHPLSLHHVDYRGKHYVAGESDHLISERQIE